MTLLSRSLGVFAVAAATVGLTAAQAAADTYAQLGAVPVVGSPYCTGSASTEALVAPLQEGDRAEDGVRVAVYFTPDHDVACAVTMTATWRNLDTGASGSGDITVASDGTPAAQRHYGFAGYSRADFWTGRGTVVVTVSTQPDGELVVTV
ncbi:hypothetical protein BH11ACT6_BH11ACT6_45170 [soil metagenome]